MWFVEKCSHLKSWLYSTHSIISITRSTESTIKSNQIRPWASQMRGWLHLTHGLRKHFGRAGRKLSTLEASTLPKVGRVLPTLITSSTIPHQSIVGDHHLQLRPNPSGLEPTSLSPTHFYSLYDHQAHTHTLTHTDTHTQRCSHTTAWIHTCTVTRGKNVTWTERSIVDTYRLSNSSSDCLLPQALLPLFPSSNYILLESFGSL